MVCQKTDGFDIIIDDGSHVNKEVTKTFGLLFTRLNDRGIYVVEGMQTSYWLHLGGDDVDLYNKNTMINYFRNMIDSINHAAFLKDGKTPSYFDKNISSMHFYESLLFIYKKNL